jgi:hypothetical protein
MIQGDQKEMIETEFSRRLPGNSGLFSGRLPGNSGLFSGRGERGEDEGGLSLGLGVTIETSTNVCRRLRRSTSLSKCFFFLVFICNIIQQFASEQNY